MGPMARLYVFHCSLAGPAFWPSALVGWNFFFSSMIFPAKDVGIPKGISQLINIPLIPPLNGNSVEYCGIVEYKALLQYTISYSINHINSL